MMTPRRGEASAGAEKRDSRRRRGDATAAAMAVGVQRPPPIRPRGRGSLRAALLRGQPAASFPRVQGSAASSAAAAAMPAASLPRRRRRLSVPRTLVRGCMCAMPKHEGARAPSLWSGLVAQPSSMNQRSARAARAHAAAFLLAKMRPSTSSSRAQRRPRVLSPRRTRPPMSSRGCTKGAPLWRPHSGSVRSSAVTRPGPAGVRASRTLWLTIEGLPAGCESADGTQVQLALQAACCPPR